MKCFDDGTTARLMREISKAPSLGERQAAMVNAKMAWLAAMLGEVNMLNVFREALDFKSVTRFLQSDFK